MIIMRHCDPSTKKDGSDTNVNQTFVADVIRGDVIPDVIGLREIVSMLKLCHCVCMYCFRLSCRLAINSNFILL